MASSGIRRLWFGYLVLAALMTVVRGLTPDGSTAAHLFALGYPLVTIAAIGAGVWLNRPGRRLPWLMLAGTMAATVVGNAVYVRSVLRGEEPFPSLADAFWLVCGPIELAGLLVLVNGMSVRRDRASVLDTLMITGGLGLGMWLLFLRDLAGPGVPWIPRLVTTAYPLGDLLLLSGAVRMLVSPARRSPAFWQLTASLAVQSLADSIWVWQTTTGGDSVQPAAYYVLSALLLGGAALHPSMATFGVDSTRQVALATPLRAVLIGSGCLLSPVLLLIDGMIGPGEIGWLSASICCVVVFLLVITRMIDLVRTVQRQADQLESLAYLDGLTGIPNRRAWDAELERRLAVARRSGEVLVVGLIDIDHFKRYNDLFGHQAGDDLLRISSTAWQGQLRPEDLIARYGGEEFGVIINGRLRDAAVIMERLRAATPEGQTFSAGLALWTGDESAAQLTARADAALYVAKRDGRDQFTVTGHPGRTDQQADFLVTAG